MSKKISHLRHSLATLSVAALFWMGGPALAQSAPAQDNDTTVQELSSFDAFMDSHPVVAEQLRKDPAQVKNEEFLEQHPDLRKYLQAHPQVQEEIAENPARFMHQERGFERLETRRELTNLDAFLDSHPEIAEQLRKNPSLANDREFVKSHPAFEQFLQEHSGVAQELRQNPDAFMREEQRFDQREDRFEQRGDRRDNDVTRAQLASMDRFLDSHPEIAEQLRKDPALVNDKKFVEHHPELQTYLQQHPGVREEYKENPNAFMRQEQRFDRREDRFEQRGQDFDRSRDFGRNEGFERNQGFEQTKNGFDRDESSEAASFGQFLGVHANIAAQVSKDPTLLNNKEFMETHPELQQYLKSHPGAQAQLQQNPQAFLQSAQQMTKPAPKAPAMPRPVQK
jgi:phage-related protein